MFHFIFGCVHGMIVVIFDGRDRRRTGQETRLGRNEGQEEMRIRIRKRIVFRGLVQGVGFRWHARQAAAALGVTGWVRNEYDGSVTMEVQGTAEEIDRMIAEIRAGRYIDVQDMEVRSLPPEEGERDFRVRGY